ncbi:VanZ family protein [Defluviitalea phaphyphila]|uniref:VanZ family protein n=1 Tax=Defluviitalea phaphyphila TaxID=1473580 RepID=UPI00073063C0|nr:VanZ family protein [Defluviitalea phaphyphila]
MILRRAIWIITLLWMSVIFYMSSRPIDLSRQDSAWVLEKINMATKEEALDLENVEAMSLQNWIRKTAHVIIFAGLSILLYVSLYGYVGKSIKTGFIAWILTVIYAITDEVHQYFVPGRGSQIQDVFRDSKGALVGCIIMVGIFLLIEKISWLNKLVSKIYNLDVNKDKLKKEV